MNVSDVVELLSLAHIAFSSVSDAVQGFIRVSVIRGLN